MPKQLKRTPLIWIAALSALALIEGTVQGGSLEPPGPPGPTMKTLDDVPPVWSQALPASERFVLVLGGVAVLDKETGLVWQRQPWTPLAESELWADAFRGCHALLLGGRMGWRLPAVAELSSLLDPATGQAGEFLPSGHPFIGIDSLNVYWTSTTAGAGQRYGFFGGQFIGIGCPGFPACSGSRDYFAQPVNETTAHQTWCVRGGAGTDGR